MDWVAFWHRHKAKAYPCSNISNRTLFSLRAQRSTPEADPAARRPRQQATDMPGPLADSNGAMAALPASGSIHCDFLFDQRSEATPAAAAAAADLEMVRGYA